MRRCCIFIHFWLLGGGGCLILPSLPYFVLSRSPESKGTNYPLPQDWIISQSRKYWGVVVSPVSSGNARYSDCSFGVGQQIHHGQIIWPQTPVRTETSPVGPLSLGLHHRLGPRHIASKQSGRHTLSPRGSGAGHLHRGSTQTHRRTPGLRRRNCAAPPFLRCLSNVNSAGVSSLVDPDWAPESMH